MLFAEPSSPKNVSARPSGDHLGREKRFGGWSISFVGAPPSIGRIAIRHFVLVFSSGVKQAIHFPSGEISGDVFCVLVSLMVWPPSMDTFQSAHFPSWND